MNIDKLVPTAGHVIIKVNEKPQEAGGLILAQTESNSAPVIGTVTHTHKNSPYQVGDEVVYRKYAVDTLKWTNKEGIEQILYILDTEEILAFISNQKDYADKKAEGRKQIEERKARREEDGKKGNKEVLEDK